MNNSMELRFPAIAENEAFARMVISAFLVKVNPAISTISEVRTAVSEAVTNVIVHAYKTDENGEVLLRAFMRPDRLEIEVEDRGCGLEDIERAMSPFYTSQPELERTGMGFSLMQSFMDGVRVTSSPGNGTIVSMVKLLVYDENDII